VDLVLLALDRPEQQASVASFKAMMPPSTRLVGIVGMEDVAQLKRIDSLGLDGVLHRPLVESDVRTLVKHMLGQATNGSTAKVLAS
jgi:AmiR/NasT family two-component response regulator